MTGLFTGIIGSLIGAGIQAAVGGIPVSDDASRALELLRTSGLPIPPANWFSSSAAATKESYSPQIQTYEIVGEHFNGPRQVLSSCVRIAQALEDVARYSRSESKSTEDSAARGASFEVEYARAKGRSSLFHGKAERANEPVSLLSTVGVSSKRYSGCGCSCVNNKWETSSPFSETRKQIGVNIAEMTEPCQENTSKFVDHKNVRKIMKEEGDDTRDANDYNCNYNNNDKENLSLITNKLSRSGVRGGAEKIRNDLSERDSKSGKLFSNGNSGRVEFEECLKERRLRGSTIDTTRKQSHRVLEKGENQSVKRQNKHENGTFDLRKCQLCRSNNRNRNKPSRLMPCGHMFCRGCLTAGEKELSRCPVCRVKFEAI